MIILTGFAIGVLTVGIRSVVCYALAGSLIVFAFALAALANVGSVSLGALMAALLAYNVGIASAVFTALVFSPRLRA